VIHQPVAGLLVGIGEPVRGHVGGDRGTEQGAGQQHGSRHRKRCAQSWSPPEVTEGAVFREHLALRALVKRNRAVLVGGSW
jgi:hypothetical protein